MTLSFKKLILLLIPLCMMACKDAEATDPNKGGNKDTDADTHEPEYSYISVEHREWKNGSFTGWTKKDAEHTIVIDKMNWYKPTQDIGLTAWGGRTGLIPEKVSGTPGYFRVASYKGRNYLLDPDNGLMIVHGTQHVRPAEDYPKKDEFSNKFGSNTQWSEETGQLLARHHFNYISYGSKRIEPFPQEIRKNLLTPNNKKIAYAENMYLLRTFMWDMSKNLGYTFDDDKYNRLVLLFEPTFASYIDQLAAEKTQPFLGDEHFVGYYLDNELPFASYKNSIPRLGIDLKDFLNLPDKYKAARQYAEKFIKERNIDPYNINSNDQEQFRGAVANYYYKITSEAIRRYDKQHLILGNRLHDWSKYNEQVVKACAKYCDVVSVNYYGRWQPEDKYMKDLTAWCSEKPFMITEFYTKGADAKYKGKAYSNTDGGGWLVKQQANRGEFHQNFCLHLLQNKSCIGWVHFEYADGGTNSKATNKGIVSMEYTPYEDFLKYVKQMNLNVYSLIDYFDKK